MAWITRAVEPWQVDKPHNDKIYWHLKKWLHCDCSAVVALGDHDKWPVADITSPLEIIYGDGISDEFFQGTTEQIEY
jgi:hypothetical protein